jgi:hypothetical protein
MIHNIECGYNVILKTPFIPYAYASQRRPNLKARCTCNLTPHGHPTSHMPLSSPLLSSPRLPLNRTLRSSFRRSSRFCAFRWPFPRLHLIQRVPEHGFKPFVPSRKEHHVVGVDHSAACVLGEGFEIAGGVFFAGGKVSLWGIWGVNGAVGVVCLVRGRIGLRGGSGCKGEGCIPICV